MGCEVGLIVVPTLSDGIAGEGVVGISGVFGSGGRGVMVGAVVVGIESRGVCLFLRRGMR